MKTYKFQVPEMLPIYAQAGTVAEALRKIERLCGPLKRDGLRVTEVQPDEDLEGETVL